MDNIWAFLVQTLTVSCVAVLLLVLKWLLMDKLSPRWQYGVWSLLALRLVLPVPVNSYVMLPVPLWVEQWKAFAERSMTSAYSSAYVPVEVSHVLPVFSGVPVSITDWLHILYAAGMAAWLVYYGVSYLRLRLLLRRGNTLDSSILEPVCRKYGLKGCRVVEVNGLETAFVCGVIQPVMAVPAGKLPDEKILLHELLHKKHWDPLQSLLWCLLRCLHWCNPFLQIAFNRIENDMESACDQWVLELLQGEERREYGGILLEMASRRYARTPGTSSISNGGRNISRRIAAIVRFKKYPRGMALVSVCIILMLLVPTVRGAAYSTETAWPQEQRELENALAATRLRRCTTAAGAIDTYAKGLLMDHVLYIATASPMELQPTLASAANGSWYDYAGEEFSEVKTGEGYLVYGLRQRSDGSYLAWLAFRTVELGSQEQTLMVPVHVSQEGNFWVIRESGSRFRVDAPRDQLEFWYQEGPWVTTLFAQGQTGTVTVARIGIYEVDNSNQTDNIFGWGSAVFDTAMKPDAVFDYVTYMDNTLYACADPQGPKHKVGIRMEPMETPQDDVMLPQTQTGTGGGGSSLGDCHQNLVLPEDWNGILEAGNGTACTYMGYEQEPGLPRCYKVGIYWDEQLVEELVVTEVTP